MVFVDHSRLPAVPGRRFRCRCDTGLALSASSVQFIIRFAWHRSRFGLALALAGLACFGAGVATLTGGTPDGDYERFARIFVVGLGGLVMFTIGVGLTLLGLGQGHA